MNGYGGKHIQRFWPLTVEQLREKYSAKETTGAERAVITRVIKEKTEANPYPKSKAQSIAQGLNRFNGAITLLQGHMKGLDRDTTRFMSECPVYMQLEIDHLRTVLQTASDTIRQMVEINTERNTVYRKGKVRSRKELT